MDYRNKSNNKIYTTPWARDNKAGSNARKINLGSHLQMSAVWLENKIMSQYEHIKRKNFRKQDVLEDSLRTYP